MKRSFIKLIAVLLVLVSVFTVAAFANDTETEDTTVTFGVFSDIHKQPLFFERVMNDLVTMANGKENIDGLALVGDIVYFQSDETPAASYYDMLDENENYKYFADKGVVSFAMGNHEFPLNCTIDDERNALAFEIFEQETGSASESHKIISGYHFITAGPGAYNGVMTEAQEQYVMDEVTEALEDGEDKPIFVLIHHPIDGTLFGSGSTRNSDEFVEFLKSQPRVIIFSGHNHYSISNPRAIRQYPGGATFMYTASVNSGNKLNDPYAYDPYDTDKKRHDTSYPSQAYIMEIDSATNVVTMKRFYVTTDNTPTWIEGGDWVLDIPKMVAESEKTEGDVDLSVYKYTYEEREENSVGPKFNDGDAITLNSVSTKDVSFTFPEAISSADGEDNMVGYYKIDVINKATSEAVATKKMISDYFKQQKSRRTAFSYNFINLTYDTEYTIKVTPVNMWYVEGTPITVDFKTGGLPGGFGTIVGYDSSYYAAPATLNTEGNGLTVDTANKFQITAENNTRLAGLYAVSNDDFATHTLVYVYGAMDNRLEMHERNTYAKTGEYTVAISSVDTDKDGYHDTYGNLLVPTSSGSSKVYVVAIDEDADGLDDNYPGQDYSDKRAYTSKTVGGVSYKILSQYTIKQVDIKEDITTFAKGNFTGSGSWKNYISTTSADYRYMVRTTGSHVAKANTNAYYSATDDTTKQTYLDKIISASKDYNVKYALTEDEIVKVSELNIYKYKIQVLAGKFTNDNHEVKFVAYVSDKNGNVTPYTYIHKAISTLDSSKDTLTVDFSDATTYGKWENNERPTDGYLVGFAVYPYYGFNNTTDFKVSATVDGGQSIGLFFNANNKTAGFYSIDTPQVPKPDYLSVDENGKLVGAAEGTTYMYAPLTSADLLNGKSLTYTSVNADTTFPAGLYSVKVLGIEGECTDSEPTILYVSGTAAQQKEIGNLVITKTAATIQTKATDDWVSGYWTGDAGLVLPARSKIDAEGNLDGWPSNYCVTSSGQHVEANAADRVGQAKAAEFKYAYDGNEIIPTNMLASFGYRAFIRSGNDAMMSTASPKSKFTIYVLNLDGTVSEYTAMSNTTGTNSTTDKVLASAFNLPEEGYIIGIHCYPFYEFVEEKMGTGLATFELMFDPADYVLKTQHTAPTVTVATKGNTLTISDYSENITYAYSEDNGDTWTKLASKTLTLTRANTYYQVKALADDEHFESEVTIASKPSAVMLFKGASLVLDGKIGLKFIFDIDKSAAHKNTQVKFSVYDGSTVINSKVGYTFINKWNGWNYTSYEEDGRTAYFTVYLPPKDYENVYVKFDCIYAYTTSSSFVSLAPSTKFSVSSYITSLYTQAAAGNAECIAAKNLVMALEAYCKNADNFFSDSDALTEVAADTTAIQNITNPKKTTTYTENAPIEHHSTSLILEDTVTIRHYFKINDETVLEGLTSNMAGFSVENIKTSESGTKYLWVDVTDIDAANLDNRYTVTLTASDENAITVTYSALNYVKQTYNSTEPKLKNISRAIFNYSQEAEKYNK